MRYRLGEFRPTPDLVGLVLRAHGAMSARPGTAAEAFLRHVIRLLAQADHSPEGALSELLEAGLPSQGALPGGAPRRLVLGMQREREALRELPDLLACSDAEAADAEWAAEVHRVLSERRELRAGLRLLECSRAEGEDGYVAIAVTNHEIAADVRVGDTIYAGFAAIRPRGGELSIRPRIHRVACTNGLIVYDATGEDALEREGSIEGAIAHCLSGAVVEKAARRLRAAARVPREDPLEDLDELAGERLRGRIRSEFDSRGDRTIFGALNAVTAIARAESHFNQRLALESAAGRLLLAPSCRRPPPDPLPSIPPREEIVA